MNVNPRSKDFFELNAHRRFHVRPAARAAQLAYGFLKGIPYKKIESKTYTTAFDMQYIKKEVKRLATKFGRLPYGKNYDEEVERWFQE
jgi:ubiquitin